MLKSNKNLILLFSILFIFSCGNTATTDSEEEGMPETPAPVIGPGADTKAFPPSTFTDPRDNREYKTVRIGKREWFAENLNFMTKASWCYDDHPFNCRKYGRLYTYDDAKKSCPRGWRMPDHEDWMSLNKRFYRNARQLYEALKVNGETGFNGELSGWRLENGKYTGLIISAGYWSQKTIKHDVARYYQLSSKEEKLLRSNAKVMSGFSCRCVRTVND